MSAPEELDPYGASRRPTPLSVARFIGRAIGVLVGVGIGVYGLSFYVLRCFSTCPTDPAENALSHILPLSILALGLAVITAAVTFGTRSTIGGAWIITGLGVMLPVTGVVTLLLVPSLPFPGDRTGIVVFGILEIAAGVGLVLFGRWMRRRTETERERNLGNAGAPPRLPR